MAQLWTSHRKVFETVPFPTHHVLPWIQLPDQSFRSLVHHSALPSDTCRHPRHLLLLHIPKDLVSFQQLLLPNLYLSDESITRVSRVNYSDFSKLDFFSSNFKGPHQSSYSENLKWLLITIPHFLPKIILRGRNFFSNSVSKVTMDNDVSFALFGCLRKKKTAQNILLKTS